MKNLNKTFSLIVILLSFMACSQTTMKSVNDAKKLELNKTEFIGKPLSYFLSHINLKIESIVPVPNKNLSEINRISFIFIPYDEYREIKEDIQNKPTRITVMFNQNGDLKGEKCTYNKPGCTEWTKEDEEKIGDLLVYNIYISGQN